MKLLKRIDRYLNRNKYERNDITKYLFELGVGDTIYFVMTYNPFQSCYITNRNGFKVERLVVDSVLNPYTIINKDRVLVRAMREDSYYDRSGMPRDYLDFEYDREIGLYHTVKLSNSKHSKYFSTSKKELIRMIQRDFKDRIGNVILSVHKRNEKEIYHRIVNKIMTL